jgi:hypothetical protein
MVITQFGDCSNRILGSQGRVMGINSNNFGMKKFKDRRKMEFN